MWVKVKKPRMVPKRESTEAKAEWELEVTTSKCKTQEAKALVSTTAGLAYNLFRELFKDKPQTQWNRITTEMHTTGMRLLLRSILVFA